MDLRDAVVVEISRMVAAIVKAVGVLVDAPMAEVFLFSGTLREVKADYKVASGTIYAIFKVNATPEKGLQFTASAGRRNTEGVWRPRDLLKMRYYACFKRRHLHGSHPLPIPRLLSPPNATACVFAHPYLRSVAHCA